MSFTYPFSFEPSTPPEFSFEDILNDPDFSPVHSRSGSHASVYSLGSTSPSESISTAWTTPARSPVRQLGPLLLPRIRHQDQEIRSPVKQPELVSSMSGALSTASRPSHHRSHTNPELSTCTPDIFMSSSPVMTALCSPIGSLNHSNDHTRRSSSASLDGRTLGKYGFPTNREMLTYMSSPSIPSMDLYAVQAPFPSAYPSRTPSPLAAGVSFDEVPIAFDDGTNLSLMTYLTSINPAPALVRQLNIHIRDTNSKHFWWDIRQIRPWTAFNISTILCLPDLACLLNIPLPSHNFPIPARTSPAPRTESDLKESYTTFYATKLNAALLIAQGPARHIAIHSSTKPTDPAFISNYTDDISSLIYGRGLGRIVGLVKSFDRWNTGMRVEGTHRKVEYLRGLAHLHRHMREHGCRYGFILTEIELVVVRNGGEAVPHFGYLEVQTIQLNTHASPSRSSTTSSFADFVGGATEREKPKMTALLALWYLHMLARNDVLPRQIGWKSEIGAPAEGTRRKCLPRDKGLPEPQLAEKREAKRVRGWVWPEEAIGRKEMGKRGVRYGNGIGGARQSSLTVGGMYGV